MKPRFENHHQNSNGFPIHGPKIYKKRHFTKPLISTPYRFFVQLALLNPENCIKIGASVFMCLPMYQIRTYSLKNQQRAIFSQPSFHSNRGFFGFVFSPTPITRIGCTRTGSLHHYTSKIVDQARIRKEFSLIRGIMLGLELKLV
jgi:hypothetical protein